MNTRRSEARQEYPPVDSGLPALPVAEVIAPQLEWMKRLRYAYGADRATFDRDIGTVVERYAQYVHLLPATRDAYFRSVGGLFRMGLQTAFVALQAADGAIFSGRQTLTQRATLEPRWRYATFIAGLLSEIHRALSHFIVTDAEGREWPAYLQPLALWLGQHHAGRYYVRWLPKPQEARALGVVAMHHIVTLPMLQYLAQGNSIVIPHLMASLAGTVPYREANTLDQLVRRSAASVIDRDLRSNVDLYGNPQLGSHLERYLVDAMRRLVAEGKWVPNAEKSRLWYGQDGMFVLWPQAASEVIGLLRQDQLPGIPQAPATLAEILAAAGVIESRVAGSFLWDVFVPSAAGSVSALKLSSPLLLLAAIDAAAAPMPRELLKPWVSDKTTAPRAPRAQLTLPICQAAAATPIAEAASAQQRTHEAEARSVAAAPLPRPAAVALVAPPRLNPAVRDVLQQIIATLDSVALPLAAFVIEVGLFVPLKAFEQRGVDPALAVRALSDAGMLVADPEHPQSKTLSRTFHDEPILGLVLAPRCIAGLDPRVWSERAQSESNRP